MLTTHKVRVRKTVCGRITRLGFYCIYQWFNTIEIEYWQ